MRLRRIERGALTLASAEVKFQIDTETHDPLDIGMLFEWQVFLILVLIMVKMSHLSCFLDQFLNNHLDP